MLNKKDLKDIYNFSERELLKIIKTSGDKIKKYSNKNPNEVKKTIMGGGLGAGLATLLGYTGSIGIVGYGLGIGVPVALLAAVGGAVVGNRMGIGKDLENLINHLEKIKNQIRIEPKMRRKIVILLATLLDFS